MTYRIDLNPETQRAVEAAAARQGVAVETYIVRAVENQAHGAEVTVNPLAEALRLLDELTPTLRAGTAAGSTQSDAAADLEILRAERFSDAGH